MICPAGRHEAASPESIRPSIKLRLTERVYRIELRDRVWTPAPITRAVTVPDALPDPVQGAGFASKNARTCSSAEWHRRCLEADTPRPSHNKPSPLESTRKL